MLVSHVPRLGDDFELGNSLLYKHSSSLRNIAGPEIQLVFYFAHGTALPTVASDLERDFLGEASDHA